jgi:Protein of unknown function (DUF3426)
MLPILLIGAIAQATVLFREWVQIPRANLTYWRVEYASLDLKNDHDHILNLQVRVESPPNFKKNQVPNLEVMLTDVTGKPVAYRNLLATQWLPDNLPLKRDWLLTGVPSQTEITTNLPINVPLEASGFQVHLIYR